MNDDHDHDVDHDVDHGVDPEFDARARAAGRALREPAPARGFEQVRAAKRRRTLARTGAALAVGVLAVGGVFALVGSGDDDLQPADEAPDSVPTVITTPGATTDGQPTTQPTTPATDEPAATDPAATNATNATAPEPAATTEPPATSPPVASVEWVPAGSGVMPDWGDRTTPITQPLADGLYWSDSFSSDGTTVTFQLVQRIRGQACVEEFGDGADVACASDGGRINDPTGSITMTADTPDASVIAFGEFTQYEIRGYRVPAAEFIRLAAGQPPSPGAPENFTWSDFGSWVVIGGGRVAAAHQEFQS
jgi:hypothetical protein